MYIKERRCGLTSIIAVSRCVGNLMHLLTVYLAAIALPSG
jgi:hypothetical protein